MATLGVFVISNNAVLMERTLLHIKSTKLFDYTLGVVTAADIEPFGHLAVWCNEMYFREPALDCESRIAEANDRLPTDWKFRLDDDEQLDKSMILGLRDLTLYEDRVYWFPRKWLWPTEYTFITNSPWYPDIQVKFWHKNRKILHAKQHDHTLFDGERYVDFTKNILHYNLIWKTYAERMARNVEYAQVQGKDVEQWLKGLGAFYLPEDHPEIKVSEL